MRAEAIALAVIGLTGCRQLLGLSDLPPLDDGGPGDDSMAPRDGIGGDAVDMMLDAPSIDAPPPCPGNYTPMGGSHYRSIGSNSNWLGAEMNCEADGPGIHLAVITSAAELALLASFAANEPWIGMTDIVSDGTWRWVTPTPMTYTAWGNNPAQQPNGGTAQNCGELRPDGWHDDACTIDQPSICECDGVVADPASYTP